MEDILEIAKKIENAGGRLYLGCPKGDGSFWDM